MDKVLKRTLMDKLGAVLALIVALLIFLYTVEEYGVLGKSVWALCIVTLLSNSIFVILTPIAIIKDTTLYLYSESQPVLYNIKPQVVNLKELRKMEISKKLLEYRAIFSMIHGKIIVHGFPATRESRINMLVEFLRENTNTEIFNKSYNNAP